MSRHLIFGVGLIGGFMAGCFASKGLSVSVFGRESMRKRFAGQLTVTDYLGNEAVTSDIDFVCADDAIKPFDFVWLTVKCTGLEQALLDMSPFVGPETVILSCQNGLGCDHDVRKAFPCNEVRRVIMASNVAQESDAHLHRGSQGDLFVEEYTCRNGQNLAQQVSCDLLEAQNIENMEAYSWAKLQLNLANAVNALADVPVKVMLGNRAYRRIISGAMSELIAVAHASGIILPKMAAIPMHWIPKVLNTPNVLFSILGAKMMDIDPTVRTSMWWDLSAKRITEVDFLNGAVVNRGHELGIACPVNEKIVALIHDVEKRADRAPFSPDVFLQRLKHV